MQGRAIRDLKADLIKKGNDLLKHTDETVKKLQAQHSTVDLSKVISEEAEIRKLIAELEHATDASKITVLEHDLRIAESRLNYEVCLFLSQFQTIQLILCHFFRFRFLATKNRTPNSPSSRSERDSPESGQNP